MTRHRRLARGGAGLLLAAAMAVAMAGPAGSRAAAEGFDPDPPTVQGSLPASTQFYADPNSQVARWVAANPGDPRQPVIASRIASQPQAVWFSQFRPATVTADVRAVTSAAAAAGRVPVLAVYMIPNRDCGGASAGGAPDIASYNSWVRSFAQGLGTGPVLIILEPDSLALLSCLNQQQITERSNALATAGQVIHQANPNAKVYFDAGHSAWNSPADQAARLNAAQVRTSADGIYSNVSNFRSTANEVSFAKAVLAALGNPGNLHAVIDTSRNGNGPAPGDAWCDPPGRALGTTPTADTGDPAIDAFLWVKPPGEADGCIATAGTFVPDYAFGLANSAPGGDTTAPTAPANLTASGVTSTSVTLSWSGSADNVGVAGYDVFGQPAGGAAARVGTATGTSHTATGLSPSTGYTFTVRARDAAGNVSAPSNAVTVTTLPGDGGDPGNPGTCRVTYAVQSQWPGGFVAEITVANGGTATVSNWTLAFAFPGDQRVTSAWNTTLTQDGPNVTARPVAHNTSIAPSASVSFGFQGTWGSSNATPASFTLNGAACTR